MSLFQCENCGCCENTALTSHGYPSEWASKNYDWAYNPDLEGKQLCSACSPPTYVDGKMSRKGGKWHDEFERVFLPMGDFFTNRQGNLEHKETGSEDFLKFKINRFGE